MLTILHTNDLHNRLSSSRAALLRQWKEELSPTALLLDAGDAIGAGNLSFRPEGEPILQLMTETGYDAMAVGNREFHITAVGFTCKLAQARFPVLCANIRPVRDDAPLPCQPSVLFHVPSVGRVGVFGVTVPMVTARMTSRHLSAYLFEDPVAAARRLAAELRPQCEYLICLSHAGLNTDQQIAAEVRELDLIVGGHSHTPLPEGIRARGCLIVQSYPFGRGCGIVHLWSEAGGVRTEAALREFPS